MLVLISDARFNSLALVIIAMVSILPATLGAMWARSAKKNSVEAKENSAGALHEVSGNGGVSDPDPTMKDYIMYVGEIAEKDGRRIDHIESLLEEHIRHSRVMDAALAEVFFVVKPEMKDRDVFGD